VADVGVEAGAGGEVVGEGGHGEDDGVGLVGGGEVVEEVEGGGVVGGEVEGGARGGPGRVGAVVEDLGEDQGEGEGAREEEEGEDGGWRMEDGAKAGRCGDVKAGNEVDGGGGGEVGERELEAFDEFAAEVEEGGVHEEEACGGPEGHEEGGAVAAGEVDAVGGEGDEGAEGEEGGEDRQGGDGVVGLGVAELGVEEVESGLDGDGDRGQGEGEES
jgi:hypothetical protein